MNGEIDTCAWMDRMWLACFELNGERKEELALSLGLVVHGCPELNLQLAVATGQVAAAVGTRSYWL